MAVPNNLIVGVGDLTLIDSSGAAVQAISVATLQDVSFDFSFTEKELMGNQIFAVASARVGAKLTGKAKMATIDGRLVNKVLNGTSAAGAARQVFSEVKASAASVTCTQTNVVDDGGVLNKNGVPMSRVTATPVADTSYTFTAGATGTYGFAAGQTGNVTLSYTYTVATGSTSTFNNQMMGATPFFQLVAYNEYTDPGANVNYLGFKFFAVTLPKISFAMKNDSWLECDLDLNFIANPNTGAVGVCWTA